MRAKINYSMIVVEDDLAHSTAIKRSLVNFENECNIHFATSLSEFNQLISKITPEIVLADVNLPDGNFITMLDKLEFQPWPIVVMTSFGDEQLAVRAIKSGVMDYIVKTPENFRNIEHVLNKNIREWRHIQRAKETDQKFRSLFNTMGQGVLYIDSDYKVTDANLAAQKILGFSLEEMKNWKTFNPPWKVVYEDGSECSKDSLPFKLAFHSGETVENQILGIEKQDDEFTWLLITSVPQFRNNENKPSQVFSTFTDITELKKAKEELEHNYNELEKAKEKAEESNRLKTTFIANISHEIRTPMSGILGFAELLQNQNLSGETQQVYIETIIKSGKRMLAILNDLIDVSKIEAGYIDVKVESTDVNNLLNEIIAFFMPEAGQRKLDLKLNSKIPQSFKVDTDKTKLSQIITNLLKNALKFTQEGFIELGCKREGDYIVFYVKDTGQGISKEHQSKIFERFEQADANVYGTQEGVGLGLAISKAFVEKLGGKIWFESVETGTTFFFTIPSKESVDTEVPITFSEKKPKESSLPTDILIAEDEESLYFFLNEFFKLKKINTIHARNGIEAVNAIKYNSKIQLVLMDARMPQMNGIEATKKIKQIKPEMRVIILSALANSTDIEAAFEAGCDDYVTKPVDFKELLLKVSEHAST
jgi:PAS domain S-box-containing protein